MSPRKEPAARKRTTTAPKTNAAKTPAAKQRVTAKAKSTKPTTTAAAKPDDMPADVMEFITAIDTYKRTHGKPFPSWSEILDIVKSLGYGRAG